MTISKKKELILKMKEQHRDLQGCIDFIFSQLSEIKSPSSAEIFEKLMKFRIDLEKHLKLENETFYPQLLRDIEANSEDVSMTKGFIAEMKEIEEEVGGFLENYKSANEIEVDIDGFEDEFSRIRRTLMLRIEIEESGVFTYWDEEK